MCPALARRSLRPNVRTVQVRHPNDASLAFLLGLALGVMAMLSVVELWINNALENGVLPITAATLAGAAAYYFVQPFFPDFEVHPHCGGGLSMYGMRMCRCACGCAACGSLGLSG